jgi:hypothetical protein
MLMILIIIPIVGATIGYSIESISAYTENASATSIKETIDEVVTDTLDGMMNDTINSLFQDTSQSVLSQDTNFNQSKFPSILDISQVPANPPQAESFTTKPSENSLDRNINDSREAIASYNRSSNPAADSNNSNSSNKTQYILDSKPDESDTPEQNYSSSDLADNSNKDKSKDNTKSVDYLGDFFDKLIQLLFKRS